MENSENKIINLPRILISAVKSGGGKTVFSSALMLLLQEKGEKIAGFKCGSDFIDPLYHSAFLSCFQNLKTLSENKSSNLDPFIYSENKVKNLLYKNSFGKSIAVIEGVMGLYDGIGGKTDQKSANTIAKITKSPTLLLVSPSDFDEDFPEENFAKNLKSFLQYKENTVSAICLNKCEEKTYLTLKKQIEKSLNIPVVGYVPNLEDLSFENRRLGLEPFWEKPYAKQDLEKISSKILKFVDVDLILSIAKSAPNISFEETKSEEISNLKIGVSLDKAFCFHNKDNISLLKSLGAKIVYFSPLNDKSLPELDGIYLTGGFLPENIKALSENTEFKNSLKFALESGVPCFSEGAGYAYLCDSFTCKNGLSYPMTGFFETKIIEKERLNNFGYHTATPLKNSLYFQNINSFNLRNFNYFYKENNANSPILSLKKAGKDQTHTDGEEKLNTFGALCYFSFEAEEKIAKAFLKTCERNKK